MSSRLNVMAVIPEGIKAVLALEDHVRGQLDHRLYELVKLRASMVNGCGFCVDMHATDLLKAGEDPRRVVSAAAWRETTFYTDAERAALALTEAVTRLGEDGVADDVWDAAVKELGEEQLANLLLAIGTINLWNRLAIPTRQTPPPLAS